MAKDRIEKHIKLTLKPKYHSDVIAILDGIEPSKVASAVIEALRVWKRGHPHREPIQTPAPVAQTPAAPTSASRSKVNLSTGFDALDE